MTRYVYCRTPIQRMWRPGCYEVAYAVPIEVADSGSSEQSRAIRDARSQFAADNGVSLDRVEVTGSFIGGET